MSRWKLVDQVNSLLDRGAREWGISRRSTLAVMLLPVFVAFAGLLAALLGKDVYKLLTADDSIGENLQVLFFALACVLSVMIAHRLMARSERMIGLLFAIAAAGLFFLVGEEVSWGQRIFGWHTPEALADVNKQGETNLHNVYGVRFFFKWAQLVIGAYGVVTPILLYRWARLAPYREQLSWLVPHFTLIPYFALLFVFRLYRTFFEVPSRFYFVVSEYNEVLELVLALGFFFFMLFQWRRVRRGAPADFGPGLAA